MKAKWIATWWNEDKDAADSRGFHDYESAVTFQAQIMAKYNRRVSIRLRGQ